MRKVIEKKMLNSKDGKSYDFFKTPKEVEVFSSLGDLFNSTTQPTEEKMRNFPVYTPRQTIARFLIRYEMFKLIQGVHGSIVEFGVFRGAGLFSWFHFSGILEPYNINRKIIGFDTFDGFPLPHPNDGELNKGGDLDSGAYAELNIAKKIHLENIASSHISRMEIIKGDICETLPAFIKANQHTIIALAYVDVNLYEPTKVILESIVKRIPKGGILAFDEVNDKLAPGETIALLEGFDLNRFHLNRFYFDSNPCYIKF